MPIELGPPMAGVRVEETSAGKVWKKQGGVALDSLDCAGRSS